MADVLYEQLLGSSERSCYCSGDSRPRIFRIPEHIQKLSTSAYTPQVVPLGPLARSYFSDQQIKNTDEVKAGTAHHLLFKNRENERDNAKTMLESCREGITHNIDRIRGLYKLSKDEELVDLMLVDGLFIVHLLLMDKLQHQPTLGNGHEVSSARTSNNAANECAVHVKEPSSSRGRHTNTAMAPFGDNAWTKKLICYDLLKVENQIPWFVLELLCGILFPGVDPCKVKECCLQSLIDHMELDVSFPTEQVTIHTEPVHLLDLFRDFLVKGCTCGDPVRRHSDVSTPTEQVTTIHPELAHLLDLFRGFIAKGCNCGRTDALNCCWTNACGSAGDPDPEFGAGNNWVPRAVELKRSYITFRKRKSSKGFLDISFKHGVLGIPPFRTSDYTCALFRNLIAYEQLRPGSGGGNHITAYIVLMVCLVDTVEDVRLLQSRRIIENRLNSDKAAVDLLNNLKHHGPYTMDGNCLVDVFTKVNKSYENKCNRVMATLKHDYCRHPWMVLGLLAGTLIVGLTVLQAVYKILEHYNPRDA